jgi:hypothetical protein
MTQFPLQDLAEGLVSFFEEHDIDYMLMGGIAVRFWGIPRPTFDVDFTLSVKPDQVPWLCERFEEQGFSVHEAHKKGFLDLLKGMNKFGVVRYAAGREVRVDMFLVTTSYQEEALGRRVRAKLNGKEVWLISPEDLILHKLVASRPRDLADVIDILSVNATVDTNYLRKWAGVLGVSELLREYLEKHLC